MSRRSIEVAALAAVLAVGGAVPALQLGASAATKPKAVPCPTWTDPAGDASTGEAPNPTGLTGDDNLDIVSGTVSTTVDSITAVIKVTKLNEGASDAGDEFHLNFTAAGKDLQLYADRGADPLGVATLPGTVAGLYNFTDRVSGAGKAVATYDLTASTVTISAKLADLAEVATVPLKSAVVSDLLAGTQDYVTGAETGLPYDEAPTTLTPTLGVACGTAKPGSKPTPIPSATPAPKPTAGGAPPVVADPTKDFPKAGCVTLTDVKGDGQYQGTAPNDPDLDITSLTLRTTSTALVAYIGVDKLAAGPAMADTHRYSLDFTFNGHVFTTSGSASAHGSSALRDGAANSGLVGHVVQLGVDVPSTTAVPPPTERGLKASGLAVTFDLTNSRVVFVLPIADIEKYGQAKLAGKLTAVNAHSSLDSNILSFPVDASAKDNASVSTDSWTVNDNVCFPVAKKK